ncbi:hypothetical protein BBR01nite_33720 [Brevibacillus brevis]|nr:hypothetical protein BBR01nite_33720 [Brevibacillus brevis]
MDEAANGSYSARLLLIFINDTYAKVRIGFFFVVAIWALLFTEQGIFV